MCDVIADRKAAVGRQIAAQEYIGTHLFTLRQARPPGERFVKVGRDAFSVPVEAQRPVFRNKGAVMCRGGRGVRLIGVVARIFFFPGP